MTKTIAVANQKGGVGKSTLVQHLAVMLVHLGNKVLVVDLDSQGSVSSLAGLKDLDEMELCISKGLKNVTLGNKDAESYIVNIEEGYDLIPGNIETAQFEAELINVWGRERILEEYLEPYKDLYDYVLIDCMSSLGMMTINALNVADSVLIPMNAECLSVKGLNQLLDTVTKVRTRLNRKLRVEGIVFQKVRIWTKAEKNTITKVRELYGSHIRVFNSVIPLATSVGEASAMGISVLTYDVKGKATAAYLELARELMGGDQL